MTLEVRFLPPRCRVDSITPTVATSHVRCENRTSNIIEYVKNEEPSPPGDSLPLSPCKGVTDSAYVKSK